MTEMIMSALELAGADMENFDAQNPKLSERMLINATSCLEAELNRKYPETEFRMRTCVRRGLNQEYDEFTLAPTDRPQDVFTARVWGAAPDFTCQEGYYGVLHSADYEALLSEQLAGVDPNLQVFSTIDYLFGADVTGATPIDQAVQDRAFFAYTWILLRPGDAPLAERADSIRQKLADGMLWGDYAVYLLLPDAPEMTKAEAFERIPANGTSAVYSDLVRFSLR